MHGRESTKSTQSQSIRPIAYIAGFVIGIGWLSTCVKAEPHSMPNGAETRAARPSMAEFIGLNVHTVGFKPDLYLPVCRRLRDYHPIDWDAGMAVDSPAKFPMTVNGVDWSLLYGKWTQAGYDVDACAMFDYIAPDGWKHATDDAHAYGESFAKFFGPSGDHKWVSSIEIGNEPAKYSEAQYHKIFQAMAGGVRAGDPKLKIATCAVMTGKPDQWSKPLSAVDGDAKLFDILNVHSYAMKEGWPTWRRSYPEDPSIHWLTDVADVIKYRDANMPGKQVWLTEFGYDSASKLPDPTGPWAKWVGVTDEQQARYIVRSFLVLSAIDLDRAYLYFFNDKDEAQLHGASGITRNYQPKPAFYAMGHLYKSLGDYHFSKAILKKEGDVYCYEYDKPVPSHDRVFVAWSPTADGKPSIKTLALGIPATSVYRVERMPLSGDGASAVKWKATSGGISTEVGGAPIFLWTR